MLLPDWVILTVLFVAISGCAYGWSVAFMFKQQIRFLHEQYQQQVSFLDAQLRQLGAVMKHEPPEVIDAPSDTLESAAIEESVNSEVVDLIARDLMLTKGNKLTEDEAREEAIAILEADALTASA